VTCMISPQVFHPACTRTVSPFSDSDSKLNRSSSLIARLAAFRALSVVPTR
jgi:hypothetical protein